VLLERERKSQDLRALFFGVRERPVGGLRAVAPGGVLGLIPPPSAPEFAPT